MPQALRDHTSACVPSMDLGPELYATPLVLNVYLARSCWSFPYGIARHESAASLRTKKLSPCGSFPALFRRWKRGTMLGHTAGKLWTNVFILDRLGRRIKRSGKNSYAAAVPPISLVTTSARSGMHVLVPERKKSLIRVSDGFSGCRRLCSDNMFTS